MPVQVFGARSSPQLQTKTITPSASTQYVTPSIGYDGLSQVTVNGDSNLISDNIKSGVNIFGVSGTYSRIKKKELSASTFSLTTISSYTAFKITLPSYITNKNLVAGCIRIELLSDSSSIGAEGMFFFPKGRETIEISSTGNKTTLNSERYLYDSVSKKTTYWLNSIKYSSNYLYISNKNFSSSWSISTSSSSGSHCILFYS